MKTETKEIEEKIERLRGQARLFKGCLDCMGKDTGKHYGDHADHLQELLDLREAITEVAHEAHMMGRIYNKMGEKETPGEVCEALEKMVAQKQLQPKSQPCKEEAVYGGVTICPKCHGTEFKGKCLNCKDAEGEKP